MSKQAILIGCGEYTYQENLKCIQNDLQEMKSALENASYAVYDIYNGTYEEIIRFVDDVREICRNSVKTIGGNDYILIYFSGHGSIHNETNYFLPSDFNGDYNKAINILDTLDGWDEIPSYIRNSWYKILLADICRTKDVNRQSHSKIREFRNAFIGFSSLENTVSYTAGSMSKFTKEIVANLEVPGMTLVDIFQSAKKSIGWSCGLEGQLPICYDSLIGDVYFLNEERFDLETAEEYLEKGKQYLKYSIRKDANSWRRLNDTGIRLIRMAADMGNDDAKIEFAYECVSRSDALRQYGIYKRDFRLAYQYYNSVSGEKRGEALSQMACLIYMNKSSDLFDAALGEKLLIESYEQYHYIRSALCLGFHYEAEGSYEKSFSYFSICAESNIDIGFFKLGEYYEKGIFVSVCGEKAVSYYEKAYKLENFDEWDSDLDSLKCLYKLANYYHNNGNNKDASRIMKYLKSIQALDEVIEAVRKEKINKIFLRKCEK